LDRSVAAVEILMHVSRITLDHRHNWRKSDIKLRASVIARRRTEEERAEAFSSASDDGGGGSQARCASSSRIVVLIAELVCVNALG
jgi:hypothetical protein